VLRQRSILMKYQGAWGVLSGSSAPPTLCLEDLTQLVKQHVPAKKMFEQFLKHFEHLHATDKIRQFVAAQEICGVTWKSDSIVRVHYHAWIMQGSSSGLQLQDLSWQESSPYVIQSALEFFGGKESSSAMASYSGAFYLQVDKIGSVRQQGTLLPFTGYYVKDYWITTMLSSQKITFDTDRFLYVQSVVRAESNMQQLEFVERTFLDMQAAREILQRAPRFRSLRLHQHFSTKE
jgi:hypothetical protein